MRLRRVGFIGCGTMGGNMAINLLKNGFDLSGFRYTIAKPWTHWSSEEPGRRSRRRTPPMTLRS